MRPKLILLTASLSLFFAGLTDILLAQVKKPEIMVVPSDDWCQANGFMKNFDNQGEVVNVPDYEKALLTFPDLNSVLGKIGSEMMKDGFQLQDLSETIQTVKSNRAEESIRQSKSGSAVASNPIDVLRSTAKIDIEFHVYWKIEKQGPRKRVTEFRLKGIDAYSNKQVAYADGSGDWVSAGNVSDADLLREAVLSKMDNFKAQLQTSFDDMFKNGREIVLKVRVWDDWGKDLESTDYGDEELNVIIEDWISENTVQGRFGSPIGTETRMDVRGVRIPLYDEKGKAMDAKKFGNALKKHLITKGLTESEIKVDGKGLGEVQLFLGGK